MIMPYANADTTKNNPDSSNNTSKFLKSARRRLISFGMALTLGLISTTTVFAGEQTGKVTALIISSQDAPSGGNPTHFQLDGAWQNKPGCVYQEPYSYWAIDIDEPWGKNLLSVLILAKTTGKSIKVWGTGSCTIRGDMETAYQIQLF